MDPHTDYKQVELAARRRRAVRRAVTYVLLALWAVIVLFPFYWMVLTSVKSYSAYSTERIPAFFTLSPTLQNYRDAFTAVPLGRYFLNTVIFTVATTAIMLVVITLAAFAFARLNFRGKQLAFTCFLALMMIPNVLRRQGGWHLRLQVPLEGDAAHLPPHGSNYRHPEGH